jgi:hypothetical protein
MKKLEMVKELGALYRPPIDRAVLVEVPPMAYLMVDGRGDPNASPEYGHAVEALYGVSYTVKFALKRASDPVDFKVMPLEGLWWSEDMTDFVTGRRESWNWTMMIAQPAVVTEALVEGAIGEAGRKKDLPALGRLRFEGLDEGTCAQVMHLGPYADEGPTVEKLHAFIAETGHERRGKHHEIYLGDPRRTAPARLRTIIRQPVGG